MKKTYGARWIFPASGPPIPLGTITVQDGRIVAVGHATYVDEDLGAVAILPGLVNAHTHLDLTGARGTVLPTTSNSFTDWLKSVIAFRRGRTAQQTQTDIRLGLAEVMATGVTMVGDIAAYGSSWNTMANANLRARVYWELIGLDEQKIQEAWAASSLATGTVTETCKWGISPHAPYTVHGLSARFMFTEGAVSATHIAETLDEAELLEHRTGPFVTFLKDLGVYQEASLAHSWKDFLELYPIAALPRHRLIVHGNYLPHDFPFTPNDTVCYCPRTHAAFGHQPHPYRAFLKRGIPVCLGTDSLASNPDLDILAEACFLQAHDPDLDGETLLKMITQYPAQALGWGHECGTLDIGKSADLTVIPWPNPSTDDPYEDLFTYLPRVDQRQTMFQGQWRTKSNSNRMEQWRLDSNQHNPS